MNTLDVTNESALPNPHPRAATPAVSLFPGIRLDQVLSFEDPLLLALRASKNWQDPATPSWLGSTLCALAAAIGPMARLFLPGGLTVNPMFNVIRAIDATAAPGAHKRTLEALKIVHRSNVDSLLGQNSFLLVSFEEEIVRDNFRRAVNGGLFVIDERTPRLHTLLDSPTDELGYAVSLMHHFRGPIPAEQLAHPQWNGSVNALLTCHRSRLPELANTPLCRTSPPPRILILPEDYVYHDVSCGHDCGFMEEAPWRKLVRKSTGNNRRWALRENRKTLCSEDAALPLEQFRAELEDAMKVVDPIYQPFLEWLPDLVASLALVETMADGQPHPTMTVAVMEHAVVVGKWLANCHFQGVQEMLGESVIPATPDTPVIPDTERRILTTLRRKGPMKPRDLARSLNRVSSADRNSGIEWLVQRNLAVWTPEGLVRAEK